MQTSAIPGFINLNATSPANKPPDSATEPRFGQMLEQQISQRDSNKPIEPPKPTAPRQEANAPATNSGSANATNTTDDTHQAQPVDAPTTAVNSAAAPAKPAAADKKDSKAASLADGKNSTDPTDASLAASAAIMALVANTSSPASKPAASADTATSSVTTDAARAAASTAAIDLAAKTTTREDARQISASAGTDALTAQATKAGTDGFGAALQTAGKASASESLAASPADLARRAGSETTQITPQMQQAAFEITPPSGPHPGDILAPRVGNDSWNQALGQRMVWMVAGTEQSASLTLNPPDLGPMQVVLHVSNGQADASFFAAQPEVRQALEAALPKLREMLSDAGVTLGQANVSAGQPQQQQQQKAADRRQPESGAVSTTDSGATAIAGIRTSGQLLGGKGMVDTFA